MKKGYRQAQGNEILEVRGGLYRFVEFIDVFQEFGSLGGGLGFERAGKFFYFYRISRFVSKVQ